MLKMLEGAEVMVPPQGGRKHPEQKMVKVNTENILFICGGAFDGIEKIIARRVNTQVIGFNKKSTARIDRDNLLQYVTHADVKTYGLIPELLGRLPICTYLDPLDLPCTAPHPHRATQRHHANSIKNSLRWKA
jgi:ATP-dependent Clp protease ATP-binding subunit ClpX